MGEEAPEEGRNIPRDNSMILLIWFKKGGHGASLFCFLVFLVYLVSWVN